MQVFNDLYHRVSEQPTVLTIGMFDGVHLGHQRLIRAVVDSAHASGKSAALVTFFPHPGVVMGHTEQFYLTSTEEKLLELERLGVDLTVVVEFTRETALIRAGEFVDLLIENALMREMWTGYDFALGFQREGNTPFLRALGARRGFGVHTIVEPVLLDDKPVSSRRVRAALRAGDLNQTNACLGRLFHVGGSAFSNARYYPQQGIRSAVLNIGPEHALPTEGNYLCRTRVNGETVAVVAGIQRCSKNGSKRVVDLSLLDFRGELCGQNLQLEFIDRLSSEPSEAIGEGLANRIRSETMTGFIAQMVPLSEAN